MRIDQELKARMYAMKQDEMYYRDQGGDDVSVMQYEKGHETFQTYRDEECEHQRLIKQNTEDGDVAFQSCMINLSLERLEIIANAKDK